MTLHQQTRTLVQTIPWLPLPQDDQVRLAAHYGTIPHDIDRWYIDRDLADAFDHVNHVAKQHGQLMFESAELSQALKDREFTKFFRHWEPTRANFDHYMDESCTRPDARWLYAYKAAKRLLMDSLKGLKGLQPVVITTPEDLLKVFGRKNSSAGFIARGKKGDNLETIFAVFNELKHKLNELESNSEDWVRIPFVCFHRSQIKDYVKEGKYNPDNKKQNRLVFGEDGASVAIEGQYAKPVYDSAMTNWWNFSGGDNPEQLRSKMQYMRRKGGYWFQTDFSKFDQTIQSWLIQDVFNIIKTLFPRSCEKEISWCAENFINSDILIPGEGVIRKRRGIPSGSYFTQIVGSMCNALMILTYLCSTVKGTVEQRAHAIGNLLFKVGDSAPMTALFLGDDSILFTRQRVNLHDMATYLNKVFGVTMSAEKTVTSDQQADPHFLKRDWTSTRGEWRDPLELVIALTHPERERKYDGYSPWHIIYGLWLTFHAAFPSSIREEWLVKQMEDHGGIDALLDLDTEGLPGPLRGYGHKLVNQYMHAKAMLRRSAA